MVSPDYGWIYAHFLYAHQIKRATCVLLSACQTNKGTCAVSAEESYERLLILADKAAISATSNASNMVGLVDVVCYMRGRGMVSLATSEIRS